VSGTLRTILRLALTASALTSGMAPAQEGPLARASLSGADTVWVGQQVKVSIELLAPGYFSSAATFDLPDPDGVVLMPPQDHPVVDGETIDGIYYTVQRHELAAWPMRAGAQSIPPLSIRFAFKRSPLDPDGVPAEVTTPSLPFSVKVPPGAQALGTVISARDLSVEDQWQPQPATGPIVAGTAFKRTITFSAPDVPGMVFPPFPSGTIEGLGVYARHRLDDHSDRGMLTGSRQDEITYVCERPGTFTIPAVQFTWFDLDAQQLRTREFSAHTFEVVANPALSSTGSVARSSLDRSTWLAATTAVALAVLALLTLRRPRARQRIAAWIAPLRPVHLEPLHPRPRNHSPA
jgi:hypothetical protein